MEFFVVGAIGQIYYPRAACQSLARTARVVRSYKQRTAHAVNAIAFHLMKFGLQRFPLNPPAGAAYTFEPSLSFLGVTVYLLFRGPGRFALRPSGY